MAEADLDNSPALGGRGTSSGREPRLGGNTALHHLVLSLESDDWQTRRNAASALQEFGPNAAALLIEALSSDNVHARRIAVQSLGIIGGEGAIDALIAALADPNNAIQRDASASLTRLVVGSSNESLQGRIVRAMLYQDAHQTAPRYSFKNLRKVRDACIRVLTRIVADEDRATALSAWKLALNSETMLAILRNLSPDIRGPVRLVDCTVKASGDYDAAELADIDLTRGNLARGLVAVVEQVGSPTEADARRWLIGYESLKAGPVCRAIARGDHDWQVRGAAIQALGRIRDRDSAGLVADSLLNDNPTRIVAARALIRIARTSALAPVTEAILREPDAWRRRALVLSLGQIFDYQCMAVLFQIAETDREPRVSAVALGVLASRLSELEPAEAIGRRLLATLNTVARSRPVDRPVINGYGYLAGAYRDNRFLYTAARKHLLKLLDNQDSTIRARAVLALEYLAPDDAVPLLVRAVLDTGRMWEELGPGWEGRLTVGDAAAATLEKIGTAKALEVVAWWRRAGNPRPL